MASDFRFVYNIVRVIFPKPCSNFVTNHSKKIEEISRLMMQTRGSSESVNNEICLIKGLASDSKFFCNTVRVYILLNFALFQF